MQIIKEQSLMSPRKINDFSGTVSQSTMQVSPLEGDFLPCLVAPDENRRLESQYITDQSIPVVFDASTGQMLEGSAFMHPDGYLVPPPGYSFVESAQPVGPWIYGPSAGLMMEGSSFMNSEDYLAPQPEYSFVGSKVPRNTSFGSSYGSEQQTIHNRSFQPAYFFQSPRTPGENSFPMNAHHKKTRKRSQIPIACKETARDTRRVLEALQLPEANADEEIPGTTVRISCQTLKSLNNFSKYLLAIVENLEPTSYELQISRRKNHTQRGLNLFFNLPTLDVDAVYEKILHLKSLTKIRMSIPKASKRESQRQILSGILKQINSSKSIPS